MRKTKGKQSSRNGGALLAWLLVIAGLVLLARPVAMDWWYAYQAEQAINEITSVYDDMSDPERLENLQQAQAWNASLHGVEPDFELWDYRLQLTYKSTPKSMMAWLDVPQLAMRLPIYHGTGDEVLAAGVGHCEWSALPVGGKSTHCVLTAHSGMDRARMFDDIRNLGEGDVFVVWALNEPYAYRVCDIQVILPEQTELLKLQKGRDLCSLVTCTPFGINSHRLVVTGERCEYDPSLGQTQGPLVYLNSRTIPLLVALSVVFALAMGLFVAWRKRRKTANADADKTKVEKR